jgi:hypothetical protein
LWVKDFPNISGGAEARAEARKTRRIVVFEPDQELLDDAVLGRDLTEGLRVFLKELLRRKKWVRKINIPAGADDVAAVLLFTTTLKEGGLEILSELHIYGGGRKMVEKWEVAGEWEEISSMPKESLQAIDISKVRVEGERVSVDFTVPLPSGESASYVTTFDFAGDGPDVRTVLHPLLQRGRNLR